MSSFFGPAPPPPGALRYQFLWHRDGSIVGEGTCPLEIYPPPFGPEGASCAVLTAAQAGLLRSPAAWWWNGSDVVARIEAPVHLSTDAIAADGAAEAVISDIPAGAQISITGALAVPWTPVEGGSVTLTSTEPGRLAVTLRLPAPYLEWRGMIHAH